ncbi:MAG: hypothetical protein RMJ05_06985 [Thermomicrobium sp.]|nr:hypothetical protein [Thermomicrobium sp.]MDW8060010.1 hypothetical protein [Thermomicrobium sp.]
MNTLSSPERTWLLVLDEYLDLLEVKLASWDQLSYEQQWITILFHRELARHLEHEPPPPRSDEFEAERRQRLRRLADIHRRFRSSREGTCGHEI